MLDETARRRSPPLRVARRKMLADVALARGAEDRVDHRVQRDVGVAVARKATVVVAGKTYELPQVVSASGARYSAGKITWWNKGREGTLELNAPATQCTE